MTGDRLYATGLVPVLVFMLGCGDLFSKRSADSAADSAANPNQTLTIEARQDRLANTIGPLIEAHQMERRLTQMLNDIEMRLQRIEDEMSRRH